MTNLPCFTEPTHFFVMNHRRKQDTRKLYGTHAELQPLLTSFNRDLGYDVYWTVNRTDGLGRKAENITHIRAWYAEYDEGLPGAHLWEGHTPSIIIESSPGHFHCYWLLSGAVPVNETTVRMYLGSLRTLVDKTGGDPHARDLARVLRVPGYRYNSKQFEVRLIEQNDKRYKFNELCAAWPTAPEASKPAVAAPSDLTSLPPESTRLARYARWLQAAPWAPGGLGMRNGQLFRRAAAGLRDFALDAELVTAALEAEASVRYPDDWDELGIPQLVTNAAKSASAPIGRAFQQEQTSTIVMLEE